VIGVWTSVRLSCQTFFSKRYSSCSFSPIVTKLGTRDLCANLHKIVEQIFEILI